MQGPSDTAGPEREGALAKALRLRGKADECRRLAASALMRGSRESYLRLAGSYDELAGYLDPQGQTAAENAAASEFEALLFAGDDQNERQIVSTKDNLDK